MCISAGDHWCGLRIFDVGFLDEERVSMKDPDEGYPVEYRHRIDF